MFGLSPATVVLLLVIGVLLFGKDLPDVARRIGKQVLDLRRSLQGLHDEVLTERPTYRQPESPAKRQGPPPRIAPTTSKFEDDPPAGI
jgi:sec-independent protein translocase protein TatA